MSTVDGIELSSEEKKTWARAHSNYEMEMPSEYDLKKLTKEVKDLTWINDMEFKRIGKSSPLLYCPNVGCRGSDSVGQNKVQALLAWSKRLQVQPVCKPDHHSRVQPLLRHVWRLRYMRDIGISKAKSSSPWVETKEDFSESNMNRIIDYIKSALYKYEKWTNCSGAGIQDELL